MRGRLVLTNLAVVAAAAGTFLPWLTWDTPAGADHSNLLHAGPVADVTATASDWTTTFALTWTGRLAVLAVVVLAGQAVLGSRRPVAQDLQEVQPARALLIALLIVFAVAALWSWWQSGAAGYEVRGGIHGLVPAGPACVGAALALTTCARRADVVLKCRGR